MNFKHELIQMQTGNRYFVRMRKVLDKELVSELLKLESDQQEKVLAYIKELLVTEEMNKRAEQSEKDIAAGKTISMDEFEQDVEQWILQKRGSIQ